MFVNPRAMSDAFMLRCCVPEYPADRYCLMGHLSLWSCEVLGLLRIGFTERCIVPQQRDDGPERGPLCVRNQRRGHASPGLRCPGYSDKNIRAAQAMFVFLNIRVPIALALEIRAYN